MSKNHVRQKFCPIR